jgi:hypothetical protein
MYFNCGGNISKRSSDGATVLDTFPIAHTEKWGISADLAWDSKRGRLWRIDHDNRLRRINPAARAEDKVFVLPATDSKGSGSPLGGLGVAYDPRRDVLYVSFCKAGCDFTTFPGGVILKVDPESGRVIEQVFRTGNGVHTAGLAYDAATDTLWVGDLNFVRRFTLTGTVLTTLPTPVSAFIDGLEYVPPPNPAIGR